MKYFLIFLSAGGFFISCNFNDTASTPVKSARHTDPVTDTANFTSIQWIDSTYQDIGKVKKGQVAEVSWRLKNSGDRPLVIAQVSPGCGCTVADKPEKPVMPGEESVIKAKFSSSGQHEGEHRKNLSVVANTTNTTHYQLMFRVEVTP